MVQEIKDFFSFIESSPTAFHAAQTVEKRLLEGGFSPLYESERFDIKAGKKYFVKRGAALIAFIAPKKRAKQAIIAASHVDSPCLKIKPHGEFFSHNMHMLRVEAYGGPLLSTWFDKDLAIAGQIFTHQAGKISSHLIYAKDHRVIIPSLAIHLQEKKEGVPRQYLDKQEHVCPLVGLSNDSKKGLEALLKKEVKFEKLLSSDLFLVPLESPSFLGAKKELIAAYRLDNLSSAYSALAAIEDSDPTEESLSIAAFWNHEEIGSDTREGASSFFLEETLKRICHSQNLDLEDYLRLKASSLCLSLDVAHCFHPNFSARYDQNDHPLFEKGIIIKQSALMNYATNADTTALIADLCLKHKIPYQISAGHSEIRGGSTVGPITSTNMGLKTIDIGTPLLAMHSTRELISVQDQLSLNAFTKVAMMELQSL